MNEFWKNVECPTVLGHSRQTTKTYKESIIQFGNLVISPNLPYRGHLYRAEVG